jgi:Tetratricopeptide repeat
MAPAMNDSSSPESIYRCNRCGIETREPTCFVDGASRAPRGLAVTCITCARSRRSSPGLRFIAGLFGAIALPLVFLLAVQPSAKRQIFAVIIAAFVMQPLIVVLHELGHFITARLLGLQASLITLGAGHKLWSGKIFGVPIRVQGWPLLGRTYVGNASLRWLRMRVWLSVLMGPATNILLIAAAIGLWTPLVRLVGTNIVILWILYNGFLALGNLLPRSTTIAGQPIRTDGMQLLQIPFKKIADLTAYLSSHATITAWALYDDGDYAGARSACLNVLQRLPGYPPIITILSACQINLGDYAAARIVLEPLLDATVDATPDMRAVAANNSALALWLGDLHSPIAAESTARADALSNRAYAMYPCVLPYRSTRALLLTATNRAAEALTLLQYANYDLGSKGDRADQEAARAFALRHLNRREEADQALVAALRLNTTRRYWLTRLGLLPTPDTNESAP